jgi:hypothetical protein
MKPRSIQHRDGKTTVDFLMPDVDPSQINKWNSLKLGDTIRFNLTLSGFVLAIRSDMMRSDIQDLRDNSTPVVILFSVKDARIANQTGPRIGANPQPSVDKTNDSNSTASDWLSGKYEGVAKSNTVGDIPLTLELKNDGGRFSGKVESPQGPAQITGGTYINGKLILKLDIAGNELTFNVQMNAGRMVGEWELGGQKGTLDLKKVGK